MSQMWGMEKPANRHPEMLMTIDPKRPLKGACSPQLREALNRTDFTAEYIMTAPL